MDNEFFARPESLEEENGSAPEVEIELFPEPAADAPVFVPVPPAVPTEPVPAAVPTEPVPTEPVPAAAPKAPKKKGRGLRRAVAAVLVLALVAGGCLTTAAVLTHRFEAREAALQARLDGFSQRLEKAEGKNSVLIQAVTPNQTVNPGTPTQGGMTPAQVYAQNRDSVVLVKAQVGSGYSSGYSTGSGFILTADGYVVTNHHVVEGGTKLSVVIYEGAELEAKLIGSDSANDVALLKVEGENLRPVVLGDSDSLTVGDQVVAIGNPLGTLTSTLTVGYVSAMERDVNTSGFAINMLQTDAAINSGNSGGPLYNMEGHVVGITTAKYSGSSSSGASIEGIGFAIPINDVRSLLEDLLENGQITTPYLGVSVSDMDADSAAYYDMPMGAYVNEVTPGFCAEKAGLRAKDIITHVGEYRVESVNDLGRALRNFKAGETVELTVYRGGKELKLSVTLDERPQEEEEGGSWFDFLFPGRG